MHKLTKNETKRKKENKNDYLCAFFMFIKYNIQKKTYFFSFIKGKQRPPKWPINLQNMPNGVAKHAKPRPERCLTEMRYMANRNTKDALSQYQTCLIAERIYLFGYL